jgi:hypothetical protein
MELYAFTHLVFALTSFGDRPAGELLTEPELRAVALYAGVALATCLAERDWDLVGELLITRCYLSVSAELDDEAARALASAQDETGFLPPTSDPAASGGEDRDARFRALYHPTLVGLILLAAYERRDAGDAR